MKRFLIYCCAGTGGLFLQSIFAKMMNIDVAPKFSDTGNCHDLGHGAWQGVPEAVNIGDYWNNTYRPGKRLYYSHVLPDDFAESNPDIEIVYVQVDAEDYQKVTELHVCKAWPDLWTQEEYNKWASPYYPPYNKNNIADSALIRNDLIRDLSTNHTVIWFKNKDPKNYNHVINFKTIMGLDDLKLDQIVADIVGVLGTKEISNFVLEYQQLNQRLYF
jgi:hypothetical protein